MLQHVGREMKNLPPSAVYNAPDFELLAPFIDPFEPATLMEALDQGLASHRDTVYHPASRLSGSVWKVQQNSEKRKVMVCG
jgi:hypothetical protein